MRKYILLSLLFLPFLFSCAYGIQNGIGQISHVIEIEQGDLRLGVPFDLPKGINGLKPDLALSYDSANSFSSFVGFGWSFGGLSSIYLCTPPIFDLNNQFRYNEDQFCWDGKYLENSTSNQNHYTSEIDDFSRIVANKELGAGEVHNFTIKTKDNKMFLFGGTTDSVIFFKSSPYKTYQWLLKEVQDYLGNKIEYEYNKMNNFPYIRSITYANIKVEFEYEAAKRTVAKNFYKNLPLYDISFLLSNISIFMITSNVETLHSRYSFEYDSFKDKNILRRINYCGSDSFTCFKPLIFNYTRELDQDLEYTPIKNWNLHCSTFDNAQSRQLVDMNGDGLMDLVGVIGQSLYVSLSDGKNFKEPTEWKKITFGTTSLDFTKNILKMVDVNSDGLTDIVLLHTDGIYVALNTNSMLGEFKKWTSEFGSTDPWNNPSNKVYFYADVNGDKLVDVVAVFSDGTYVALNNKNEFAKKTRWTNYYFGFTPTFYTRLLVDMNKDGLIDMVGLDSNGGHSVSILYNNGSAFTNQAKTDFQSSVGLRVVDMNNDGLPDIVRASYANSILRAYVKFNLGNNMFDKEILYGSIPTVNLLLDWYSAYFIDINQDHYTDVVWLDPREKTIYASINNQSGIDPKITIVATLPTSITINSQTILEQAYLFSNESIGFLVLTSCNVFVTYDIKNKLLISDIKTSFETEVNINYGDLTEKSVYESTYVSNYPYYSKIFGKRVVTSMQTPVGLSHVKNATYYKYKNFITNLKRIEFGSFESIIQSYSAINIVKEISYYTNFPLTGKLKSFSAYYNSFKYYETSSNLLVKKSSLNDKTFLIEPISSEERFFDENNSLAWKSIQATYMDKDEFGNIGSILEEISVIGVNYTRITKNDYVNDPSDWFLSNIKSVRVIQGLNRIAEPRHVAYNYDSKTRLLSSIVYQPEDEKYSKIEVFEYDHFGNMISLTKMPYSTLSADSPRKETFEYDFNGILLKKHCNALNHCESYYYDELGNRIRDVGPNGIETTYEYDVFGRKIKEINLDVTISWTYSKSVGNAINGYYKVSKFVNGKLETFHVYDQLNREVQIGKVGWKGEVSIVDIEYDVFSRLVKQSIPRYESSTKLSHITFQYDFLGRKIFEKVPLANGVYSETSMDYDRNEVTVTKNGKKRKLIYNNFGKIETIVDEMQSKTSYNYDAYGNLELIVDPEGHITKIVYNSLGNKIELDDPSMGRTLFDYNIFGELVYQKDAKNQETFLKRDLLGRLVERKEREGSTFWEFDTATNGIGKISTVKMLDYQRNHEYDSKGREIRVAYKIENEDYIVERKFDQLNRVVAETYPNEFTYYWCYNNYNFLVGISKNDPNCNSYLWKSEGYSANGNLLDEIYENNFRTSYLYDDANRLVSEQTIMNRDIIRQHLYTFDKSSNLLSREIKFGNDFSRKGNFKYDELDRLSRIEFSFNDDHEYVQFIGYDKVGNINSNTLLSSSLFTFDKKNPFAVIKAGDHSYSYDLNGNMIKRDDESIIWSSYNFPVEFITSKGARISYKYGPEREKIKRVDLSGDETIYIGNFYERVKRPRIGPNDIVHKYLLNLNGKVIVQTLRNWDGSDEESLFFNSDYTGSLDTVSLVDGKVLYHFNYSAWGEQSIMVKSDEAYLCLLNRGFGAHEHMGELGGLIHMNGRVYDPVIGRFLSPDPFISDFYNPQELNRYSYVLNNPFKYKDPTGHFFQFIFSILGHFLFSSMMNILTPYIATFASQVLFMSQTASKIFTSAIIGGIAGIVKSNGDLKAGLSGMLFGAAFGAIDVGFSGKFTLGRIAVESVTGGVINKMQGRDFMSGFVTTFIFSSSRYLYNQLVDHQENGIANDRIDSRPGIEAVPESVRGENDPPKLKWYNGEERFPNSVGTSPAFKGFASEGQLLSQFLNAIPGINSVAVLHDNMQLSWDNLFPGGRTVLNFPSMIPAFLITYGAMSSGPQSYGFLIRDDNKRMIEKLENDKEKDSYCPSKYFSTTSAPTSHPTIQTQRQTTNTKPNLSTATRSNSSSRIFDFSSTFVLLISLTASFLGSLNSYLRFIIVA